MAQDLQYSKAREGNKMAMSPKVVNSITVDVEEYFHPEEVRSSVAESDWTTLPSRVESQVSRVLDLFDRNGGVKATFFVLGWVAEHHPRLLRNIVRRGHEIGCHSYAHKMVYTMTKGEFRQDTIRAVAAIEDACGVSPLSYRAPSYSITAGSRWALEVLVECGFTHDSSIYPISHDRYGIPGFYRHAATIDTPAGSIQEVPVGTVKVGEIAVTPIGGGGYLRLLPYRYTAAGIRLVNETEQQPVCLYFHPWELDPEQPRLATGRIARMRTYHGLDTMEHKIERLLNEFEFSTLSAVHRVPQYTLKGMTTSAAARTAAAA
jgi:polysaccharide deacetylase family protein (PEP-CTERM system associated)